MTLPTTLIKCEITGVHNEFQCQMMITYIRKIRKMRKIQKDVERCDG